MPHQKGGHGARQGYHRNKYSPDRRKKKGDSGRFRIATLLERETGVGPATSTLARSRSTTELFPRIYAPSQTRNPSAFAKETMREKGLEPSRRKALDPKSSVSAIPPLSRTKPHPSGRTVAMSRATINLPRNGRLMKPMIMSRAGFEPATRRLRVCCSAS